MYRVSFDLLLWFFFFQPQSLICAEVAETFYRSNFFPVQYKIISLVSRFFSMVRRRTPANDYNNMSVIYAALGHRNDVSSFRRLLSKYRNVTNSQVTRGVFFFCLPVTNISKYIDIRYVRVKIVERILYVFRPLQWNG